MSAETAEGSSSHLSDRRRASACRSGSWPSSATKPSSARRRSFVSSSLSRLRREAEGARLLRRTSSRRTARSWPGGPRATRWSLMSEAMRSVAWTIWREESFGETRHEREGVGHRQLARLRERVDVADDADALGHGQLLVGGGDEPAQQVALVERAVVAELAVVGEDPRGTPAAGRGHRALAPRSGGCSRGRPGRPSPRARRPERARSRAPRRSSRAAEGASATGSGWRSCPRSRA